MNYDAGAFFAVIAVVGLYMLHEHRCYKRNANDQCAKCGRDVPAGNMTYIRLSTRPASGGEMRGFCPECTKKVITADKIFWIISIAIGLAIIGGIMFLKIKT